MGSIRRATMPGSDAPPPRPSNREVLAARLARGDSGDEARQMVIAPSGSVAHRCSADETASAPGCVIRSMPRPAGRNSSSLARGNPEASDSSSLLLGEDPHGDSRLRPAPACTSIASSVAHESGSARHVRYHLPANLFCSRTSISAAVVSRRFPRHRDPFRRPQRRAGHQGIQIADESASSAAPPRCARAEPNSRSTAHRSWSPRCRTACFA